ncbi:MAG: hypothetical protein ACT4NV_05625 [Rhodoferax sp.]
MFVFVAELRWVLMVLSLVLFGAVFGAMLVSAWRQHRVAGLAQGNFHASVLAEVSWMAAPMVIVFLLVWPTVRSVLVF